MKRTVLLFSLLVVSGWLVSAVYAASVEVVSIRKITEGGSFNLPQWSPDGKKIYALSAGGSIVVMNADGSGLQTLSSGDGHFREFVVSPDGTKILFEYNESNKPSSNLWMMNSDGTNKVKVADSAEDPGWSPSGERYCYVSIGTWVSNVDGSETRKIAPGIFEAFLDEDTVLYSYFDSSGRGLYSVEINNNIANMVLLKSTYNVKVSDEASKIYFTYGGLFVFDVVSGNVAEIGSGISNVGLSNGSEYIGYIKRTEDSDSAATLSADLWILSADGSENVQVTDSSKFYASRLSWSPDNLRIVFSTEDGDDLYLAMLDLQ